MPAKSKRRAPRQPTASPRKARMPGSSYESSTSSRKGGSNARRDRSAKSR